MVSYPSSVLINSSMLPCCASIWVSTLSIASTISAGATLLSENALLWGRYALFSSVRVRFLCSVGACFNPTPFVETRSVPTRWMSVLDTLLLPPALSLGVSARVSPSAVFVLRSLGKTCSPPSECSCVDLLLLPTSSFFRGCSRCPAPSVFPDVSLLTDASCLSRLRNTSVPFVFSFEFNTSLIISYRSSKLSALRIALLSTGGYTAVCARSSLLLRPSISIIRVGNVVPCFAYSPPLISITPFTL